MNFISWTMYGIVQGDPAVLRVNVIGCGFFVFYSTIFVIYAAGQNKRNLLLALATMIAVCGIIFPCIILLLKDKDTQISILGGIAIACNVLMYAAPLKAVRAAARNMDPTQIPILLTAANTIVSATWMTYGLLVTNWFIVGPNVPGLALNIIQVIVALYVTCRVARDPSLSAKLHDGHHDDEEGEGHEAAPTGLHKVLSMGSGNIQAAVSGYSPLPDKHV